MREQMEFSNFDGERNAKSKGNRTSEELPKKETQEKSGVFDAISREKINEYKEKLWESYKTDLFDIDINIAHPGDDLFNHYEIQQKLFLKCNSDFGKMINLIREYNYNPDNITIDQFKDIANQESIVLEGKYPGFAMTAGDDEIIFFGIKEENIIEMAEKYALKENERKGNFSDIEEAKNYLENLGEKYFLHETGHIVYKKMRSSLQKEWETFIEKYPDLKKKVVKVQEDKYNDEKQIPIADEAFADFFIDVSSNGRFISRLGENIECVDKLRALFKKDKVLL